jgi:alanyl-tRNA synthetase
MALFGEKYGETVRTITIPRDPASRFSYELCGGTHVRTTSEIGPCLIVEQSSPGAGNRRIVAVTGRTAQGVIRDRLRTLNAVAKDLGSEPEKIEARVLSLVEELHESQHRLDELEREAALSSVDKLLAQAEEVNGISLIAAQAAADDPDLLGELADRCRDRIGSGVVVLGAIIQGEVRLVAKVSPDLAKQGVHAGKLVGSLARLVGGNGGGRPDFATAGGKTPSKLPEALKKAKALVAESLH